METLSGLIGPMLTTWPALTEAIFLLGDHTGWAGQELLWALVFRDDLMVGMCWCYPLSNRTLFSISWKYPNRAATIDFPTTTRTTILPTRSTPCRLLALSVHSVPAPSSIRSSNSMPRQITFAVRCHGRRFRGRRVLVLCQFLIMGFDVKVHGGKKVADRSAILALGSRSEPRRSKVPSPPTREGRGEGNVRVKSPLCLSQVVARSHSCSTISRREDHLPSILNGVTPRTLSGGRTLQDMPNSPLVYCVS